MSNNSIVLDEYVWIEGDQAMIDGVTYDDDDDDFVIVQANKIDSEKDITILCHKASAEKSPPYRTTKLPPALPNFPILKPTSCSRDVRENVPPTPPTPVIKPIIAKRNLRVGKLSLDSVQKREEDPDNKEAKNMFSGCSGTTIKQRYHTVDPKVVFAYRRMAFNGVRDDVMDVKRVGNSMSRSEVGNACGEKPAPGNKGGRVAGSKGEELGSPYVHVSTITAANREN